MDEPTQFALLYFIALPFSLIALVAFLIGLFVGYWREAR